MPWRLTWPTWRGGRSTLNSACAAPLKASTDAPFGTVPASGSYNQALDPRLLYANPLTGQAAASNLAQQLQMVARLVEAGPSLGMRRQVFFVNLAASTPMTSRTASMPT